MPKAIHKQTTSVLLGRDDGFSKEERKQTRSTLPFRCFFALSSSPAVRTSEDMAHKTLQEGTTNETKSQSDEFICKCILDCLTPLFGATIYNTILYSPIQQSPHYFLCFTLTH